MLNQTRLWDGANVNTGGIWDPHVFDRGELRKHCGLAPPLNAKTRLTREGNVSNNPTIENPLLQGAIMVNHQTTIL